MLFSDVSQLSTQSGLVEKQPHFYIAHYKSKVNCLIKNINNFSKSDNIKTGKTAKHLLKALKDHTQNESRAYNENITYRVRRLRTWAQQIGD